MYRISEYEENKELFEYLSWIVSKTIDKVLVWWAGDRESCQLLYSFYFTHGYGEENKESFFRGISAYLPVPENITGSKTFEEPEPDDQIGIEFVYRKAIRMREKLLDKDIYDTFDIFEELLLSLGVAYLKNLESDEGTDQKILDMSHATKKTLISRFDIDQQTAEDLATCICCPGKLGDPEGDIVFWDRDCEVAFEEGFVPGIRKLVGGLGHILMYMYDDIASIFTDLGIEVPILLVGTEAAYNIVGNNVVEQLYKKPPLGFTSHVAEFLEDGEESGGDSEDFEGDVDSLPFP